MNDEFLHALRRDPPPEFARELQRRLQRQSARRGVRSPVVRSMLAVLLIGGVAVAAALLFRDREEPPHVDAPMAQQAAPSAPVRAAEPEKIRSRDPQVTGNGGTASQPESKESEANDIPLAFVTSTLARPLADALTESTSRYGRGFVRTRVMIMEEDEAFRALCGNADFVMVSRRIAAAELAQCRKWGIDVVEWKLGYLAVVLTAGPAADPAALTPREVFLALAKRIPDPAEPSRLIENPNGTWHDVDARFDYRTIDVVAPSDATARALFAQLVMEPGCETYPWIRGLRLSDRPRYDDVCHQLRSDGRYREVELSSTLITQRLWAEPNWLIVLGYSYYTAHRTELLGTMLEGPAPTLASLADGTYPAARPVYVYAQRNHLDWNFAARTLAYHLSDESALGPHGYLGRAGLVPLDEVPRRMPPARPALPPALESLQP
jgi:phosphate transport system substrate-binding protein